MIAPSSPFDEARFEAGAAWLGERYDLRMRPDVRSRHGYLAGDDRRRRDELAAALSDGDVAAIVVARGGYGALRICAEIDWAPFVARPKWLVGFSDVTALHVEASRHGIASLHAPMLAWLGAAADDARRLFVDALEGRSADTWSDLSTIAPGRASGPAFGGNLALLEACAAAGRLLVPEGAVLFLEDCTERPYRIDRMLTALRLGRHLARVSAIVLGDFTDCDPGPDGVPTAEVLTDRLADLGVPVVSGAPFGHGARNRPFVIGADVEVDADRGRVAFPRA